MLCGIREKGVAVAVLVAAIMPVKGLAGPLDPMQFASLGTLSLSSGSYTMNATGATPTLTAGGTTYTGIVYNGIAVFDFSSITIANGATLSAVQGVGLPIALLSQSSATIDGRIDVSAFGNSAGPGAGNLSVGGNGVYTPPSQSNPSGSATGGGGGGFGGAGGAGGGPGGAGGAFVRPYLFNTLVGGSNGGGSGFGIGYGGGGGGGVIEIVASQTLRIGGEVDAIGGDGPAGGGGSGGGIALAATNVLISGTIDARGGAGTFGNNGQNPNVGSGGGGGGLINIDIGLFGTYQPGTVNIGGGSSGAFGSQPGTSGLISVDDSFDFPAVPEPPSLILLGTSTLGLLGVAAFRRSRGARAGC